MAPTAALVSLFAALALPLAGAAPSGRIDGIGLPIKNFAVAAENLVPNSYIVVYNETFAAKDIATHQNSIMAMISTANVGKRSLDGRSLSTKANTYSFGSFHAMSLEAEESLMMEINNHEAVKYIEQNAIFSTQALATQTQATTGLARLSHASTNGSGYYYDPSAGQGITAFVVDTGVKLDHEEFEGRAVWGANFVDNDVSLYYIQKPISKSPSPLLTLPYPLPCPTLHKDANRRFNATRTRTAMATAPTSPAPSAARHTA